VYAACALAGLGDLPDTLMSGRSSCGCADVRRGMVIEPFRRRLHVPKVTGCAMS
jgi:hypothetical protein